jgi:hypothetical protein
MINKNLLIIGLTLLVFCFGNVQGQTKKFEIYSLLAEYSKLLGYPNLPFSSSKENTYIKKNNHLNFRHTQYSYNKIKVISLNPVQLWASNTPRNNWEFGRIHDTIQLEANVIKVKRCYISKFSYKKSFFDYFFLSINDSVYSEGFISLENIPIQSLNKIQFIRNDKPKYFVILKKMDNFLVQYYDVSIGTSEEIERFNLDDLDYSLLFIITRMTMRD